MPNRLPWYRVATPDAKRALNAADWRRTMEAAIFRSNVDPSQSTPDLMQRYGDAAGKNPILPKPPAPGPSGAEPEDITPVARPFDYEFPPDNGPPPGFKPIEYQQVPPYHGMPPQGEPQVIDTRPARNPIATIGGPLRQYGADGRVTARDPEMLVSLSGYRDRGPLTEPRGPEGPPEQDDDWPILRRGLRRAETLIRGPRELVRKATEPLDPLFDALERGAESPVTQIATAPLGFGAVRSVGQRLAQTATRPSPALSAIQASRAQETAEATGRMVQAGDTVFQRGGPPIGLGAPQGPQTADAILRETFNIADPPVGLTRSQRLENLARRMVGKEPLNEVRATAGFEERGRWRQQIRSVANTEAEQLSAEMPRVFRFNDRWQVTDLAGKVDGWPDGPALPDLIEHRPRFEPFLSDTQRTFLDGLQGRMQPYNLAASVANTDLTAGVAGKAYAHRAYQGRIGERQRTFVRASTAQAGGRETFERTRQYQTTEQAIRDGWQPKAPWDEVREYIQQVGESTADSAIARAAQEWGGQTAASRIPAGLRKQWERLGARAQSARQTLTKQEARLAAQQAERERLGRAAQGAQDRAQTAGLRARTADPEDLRVARQAVEDSVADGRRVAREIGQNVERVREANGTLSDAERALLREADALDSFSAEVEGARLAGQRTAQGAEQAAAEAQPFLGERAPQAFIDEANIRGAAASDAADDYQSMLADRDRIESMIGKLADRAAAVAARVDSLVERGAVLKDIDRASRQAFVEGRRAERAAYAAQRVAAKSDMEVRLLERAAERADTAVRSASGRVATTETRQSRTRAVYEKVKADRAALSGRWQRAQALARQTPRDRGQIDLAELRGTDFPIEVANAANRILARETRQPGVVEEIAATLNNLYRGVTSTLDNSVWGNQLLMMLGARPHLAGRTARVNYEAWKRGGDKALGKFIDGYDRVAQDEGLPVARIWARNGAYVGSNDAEFVLDRGLGARLKSAPGVRQANRAFGTTGSVARLEWMQDELRSAMRETGKTWQELEQAGELRKIADAINGATGYSPRRFGGQAGDYFLYAPRFFQARAETLVRAARGTLPGASLEQRIARQSLFKMISRFTVLTVAANAARGKDTDFRPWVGDRPNGNFMNIRDVGGHDYNLFGTWLSIPMAMANVASGHPDRAIRSLGSGVVKDAWDLMSGEDPLGRPVTDTPEHFAAWVLENHAPFSAGGIADSAGEAITGPGSAGERAGGFALAAATDLGGFRESPLSTTDRLDNWAREQTFTDAEGNQQTGTAFYDLPRDVQMQAPPELIERRSEERLRRAGETAQYERVKQEQITRLEGEAERLRARQHPDGTPYTGEDFRDAIRDARSILGISGQVIYASAEKQPGQDAVLDGYVEVLEGTKDPVSGKPDWDAVEQHIASLPPAAQDYLDRVTGLSFTEVPEVARFRDISRQIARSGYWDSADPAYRDVGESLGIPGVTGRASLIAGFYRIAKQETDDPFQQVQLVERMNGIVSQLEGRYHARFLVEHPEVIPLLQEGGYSFPTSVAPNALPPRTRPSTASPRLPRAPTLPSAPRLPSLAR